jgi:hypothetical protein
MGDVLNEAYGILECKECPWYKLCISPVRFSAEDIKRQMEAQSPLMTPNQSDPNNQALIASMAAAAQSQLLEGCPIFIERLRNNAKLAQRVKELVQDWNEEDNR